MQILLKFVFSKILRATFYSTFALTFCVWIVQSSRYMNLLDKRSISLSKFIKFTSYLSVDIIAVILPIALAVSAAFVFCRFCESKQLIALQSAGISPRKMLRPLLLLVSLTTGYLYISNMYISPIAWRNFRNLEFKIKNDIHIPETSGQIFVKDNFSVYVQNSYGNFRFRNIFIVDNRDESKIRTYFAASGMLKGNILHLSDGERIDIDLQNNRDTKSTFASYQYDLREIFKAQRQKKQPNERFMSELLYDTDDAKKNTELRALFHQKISSLLLCLIFALAAYIAVILAPFARRYSYKRIFVMATFIIILQGVYFWIANAAAKDYRFVALDYAVPAACLLLEIFIIANRKRRQRA